MRGVRPHVYACMSTYKSPPPRPSGVESVSLCTQRGKRRLLLSTSKARLLLVDCEALLVSGTHAVCARACACVAFVGAV
jgi:hypothetical protein